MWFKRTKSYDRFAILAAADKARARGKLRKAIAAYRKVLAVDPHDYETHGKIAPLLAETKQPLEAWSSYVIAGEGYRRDGHGDKALSIYAQAARNLPRQAEVWEILARLQINRDRRPDAIKTLLDGSLHFRRRNDRVQAIRLLRTACSTEPWHFDATFELARLLAKTGERREARQLLVGLAERVTARNLRRVHGALFKMSPSFTAARGWLNAAIAAREIPFPRTPAWKRSARKATRGGTGAKAVRLTILLLGAIVMGMPYATNVSPYGTHFLLIGGGLTVVGLLSLLFF